MAERVAVVSQPMFIPWIGLFDQVRLADDFVHYDDVQLPQGRSFMNRVQIKTDQGVRWLTAPIDRERSGVMIGDVRMCPASTWRPKHLRTLQQTLARAPHADLAMTLAERIYDIRTDSLAEFNIQTIEEVARWLGLAPRFLRSSTLGLPGSSSERLLRICKGLGASTYLTGHGAFRYLDHELFDSHGVQVRYMRYACEPYPQSHGPFTPYVTVLDAVAHRGASARDLLLSTTVEWRAHVPLSA
jgi:hypothetical protein